MNEPRFSMLRIERLEAKTKESGREPKEKLTVHSSLWIRLAPLWAFKAFSCPIPYVAQTSLENTENMLFAVAR